MQTNYTQEKIFMQPGDELESSGVAFSIQPSKSLSEFAELLLLMLLDGLLALEQSARNWGSNENTQISDSYSVDNAWGTPPNFGVNLNYLNQMFKTEP